MTSKEALKQYREIYIDKNYNGDIAPSQEWFLDIIEKDLEVLNQLEILKNYYPPFKEFLEEMFKNGYNEDLTKIKEWLEDDI